MVYQTSEFSVSVGELGRCYYLFLRGNKHTKTTHNNTPKIAKN